MNTLSPLILFYSGHGMDNEERTIAEILAWDDVTLESVRNYIPWLFPLNKPSRFYSYPPLLTAEDVAAFQQNATMRSNLLAAFTRMLAFYGFELRPDGIFRLASFADKAKNWLTPGNHNFLRITRILRCLFALGFRDEARAFMIALARVYEENPAVIGGKTYDYWRTAC